MTEYTLTQSETQPQNSLPARCAYDTFRESFAEPNEPTFYERYCSGTPLEEVLEWERELDEAFYDTWPYEVFPDLAAIAQAKFVAEGHALLRKVAAGLDRLGVKAQDSPYVKTPIPSSLRWRVFQNDGYQCVFCKSREDLTADHIFPEVSGGPAVFENLQTLCRPCNSRKGGR